MENCFTLAVEAQPLVVSKNAVVDEKRQKLIVFVFHGFHVMPDSRRAQAIFGGIRSKRNQPFCTSHSSRTVYQLDCFLDRSTLSISSISVYASYQAMILGAGKKNENSLMTLTT